MSSELLCRCRSQRGSESPHVQIQEIDLRNHRTSLPLDSSPYSLLSNMMCTACYSMHSSCVKTWLARCNGTARSFAMPQLCDAGEVVPTRGGISQEQQPLE